MNRNPLTINHTVFNTMHIQTRSQTPETRSGQKRFLDEFLHSKKRVKRDSDTDSQQSDKSDEVEGNEDDTNSKKSSFLLGPCVSGYPLHKKHEIRFDFMEIDTHDNHHRIPMIYPCAQSWKMTLEIGQYSAWSCSLKHVESVQNRPNVLNAQFAIKQDRFGDQITQWFTSQIDATFKELVEHYQFDLRDLTQTPHKIEYQPILREGLLSDVELNDRTEWFAATIWDNNIIEQSTLTRMTTNDIQINSPVIIHLSVRYMILTNNTIRPKLGCTKIIFATIRKPISFTRPRRAKLPWPQEKQLIYDQDYKCNECRIKLPPTYHLDHKIPLHKGGPDVFGNIQALCPNCHADKTYRENMARNYG